MIDLVTQRSANYLIIPYLKKKERFDALQSFLFNCLFFFSFYFHEDCHESSGCSIAHTGGCSMHVCEYVYLLFCVINYYFNRSQGHKFFKKTA